MELGNTIKFYNNKITVELWDDDDEKWHETSIKELPISFNRYLRQEVEFDENLTVKGFMNQLKPYKSEIEGTFEASTYGYKLQPYYDNIDLGPEEGQDDIEEIEFYWAAELWDSIIEYTSFHGYKNKKDIPYSLCISPIKDWQNAKLILNKEYKVYNLNLKIDAYKDPILSTKKEFTLYQLLDCFLFELSYHGYPENQKEFAKTLEETSESINKGELKTIPFEKVLLELKEQELEEFIKAEDYEKAEEIRIEIENLKNNIEDEDS